MNFDTMNDRYARYEDKMRRTVAVLDWIRGHRVLSCLIVGIFLFLLAAGFIIPGFVARPLTLSQSSYVYGETAVWDAKVLFRPYYVEYATADSDAWTTETPVLPGNYQIRLVKENALHVEKRKSPLYYSIVSRPIDVILIDSTVEYGVKPAIAADMVYGEKIAAYDVAYDDLTQTSTFVTALANTVCIVDINGTDVTDRYVLQTSAMPIDFIPKTIVLYANDADFIYDGTAQQCVSFTAETAPAFADQYYVVTSATSLQYPQWMENRNYTAVTIQAPESSNHLLFYPDIKKYNPDFKTFVDDPEHALNWNTVGGIVITAENEQTYAVLDGEGRDCSANYRFVCVSGELTIDRRDINIKTADTISVVYDGQSHVCSSAVSCIDGTTPAQGESAVALAVESFTNVGRHQNILAVWMVNPNTGYDMSGFYNMTITEGYFEITQRPITVTVPDVRKIYDGTGNNDCTVSVTGGLGLVSGHTLYVKTFPNVSDVGTYENTVTVGIKDADGKDVTDNYAISYVYGTLTITPRPLSLTTGSAQFIYNGTQQYTEKITVNEESALINGDRISVTAHTGVTYCSEGIVDNVLTFCIMHGKKKDVTSNYDISVTYGTLQVTPRPLTVTLQNFEKTYDATPLTSNEYVISVGSLPAKHTMTLVCGGSQTVPGSCQRTFSGVFTVLNGAGADVSDCFTVTCAECGTLTVTPRRLNVDMADFTKEYDGTPLYAQAFYEVQDGCLLPGHTFTCTVNESQTEIGWCSFGIHTFRVTDENGRDVTSCYSLSCGVGHLTVTPILLLVASQNVTQYYSDGAVLQNGYYWIAGGHLMSGHWLYCTVTGYLDTVGKAENTISSVQIYSVRTGEDVSYLYDAKAVPGTLRFMPQETDKAVD